MERTPEGLVVHAGARSLGPVDEIVVTTGLRPDLTPLSELRLGLDPAVETPTALAPLIDPNLHSCGTVRPRRGYQFRCISMLDLAVVYNISTAAHKLHSADQIQSAFR